MPSAGSTASAAVELEVVGPDGLVARFGAVTVLTDLLMTLTTCELRQDFSQACGRGSRTWRRSGNNSGVFDAAGLMRAPTEGQRGHRQSILNLTNNLLLAIRRLRPYALCKQ